MPSSLLRKGLFSSIEEFLRSIDNTGGAKINFNNNCNSNVADEVSIHIYRVIKEVLHNGIKHANASEITLECKEDKNWLTVHYYDNGKGFEFEKALATSTGFGLRNLKSRVEIVRGSLVAQSKPGKGTAFLFKFPIN
jgi:signal transduction histidine kinase